MEPCIDKSEKMFVIVPAFNEREVISEVVASIQRVCCDVVVVDDGSRDDTGQRALNAGASLVRHSINLGQGAALQTGIEFALRRGARYIVMLDADGQHDPTEIPQMFDAMRAARAEVALGSRFLGHAIGISRSRRLLLHTARMVNFIFTGLKLSDAHNGFRLLTREAASRINLRQPRMAHATEIIAQIARSKLSFIEVPVTIRYTDYSVAKGQKMSNSINILIDLILRGLLR